MDPDLDLDPDPYGHFWDHGSGSARKIMRIRKTDVTNQKYLAIGYVLFSIQVYAKKRCLKKKLFKQKR